MTATISKIHGREILDSRGIPTVEVELTLSDGSWGRAMVPSGASKGQHEALELRDGDPARFLGKGTLVAVKNINEIINKLLCGQSFETVKSLDDLMIELDGTSQKSELGANAILGVSLAFAHALSQSQKRPLFLFLNEQMNLGEKDLCMPVPLMNIINGGVHANNGLEIQEFMVVPHGFDTFADALRAGVEVFHHLKKKLGDSNLSTAVGDEGGFAPLLKNNREALEFVCEAIEQSGYILGKEVSVALDVAGSSFYNADKRKYLLDFQGEKELSRETLIDYYEALIKDFPLVSIEDGLDENDWTGWKTLTQRFGNKL